MTNDPTCAICGRPVADQAYVCAPDALSLAEALRTGAGHAEDAEAVVSRQVRYTAGGSGGSEDPLPYDPTASERLAAIENTIGTWARVLIEETGRRPSWRPKTGPLCAVGVRCGHDSCRDIRWHEPPTDLAATTAWLAQQVGTLRKHPAAAEAFDELTDACDQLTRLVDRPADKELVGMCDCGKVLYAPRGKVLVTCPVTTCKLHWNVEQSRDILRKALDGKLVTAGEAARLGQYLDGDRTQDQIRALISRWVRAGLLVAHGEIQDQPTYRFGEVTDRLARTPRRERRAA
jgi:hypothetical protein